MRTYVHGASSTLLRYVNLHKIRLDKRVFVNSNKVLNMEKHVYGVGESVYGVGWIEVPVFIFDFCTVSCLCCEIICKNWMNEWNLFRKRHYTRVICVWFCNLDSMWMWVQNNRKQHIHIVNFQKKNSYLTLTFVFPLLTVYLWAVLSEVVWAKSVHRPSLNHPLWTPRVQTVLPDASSWTSKCMHLLLEYLCNF